MTQRTSEKYLPDADTAAKLPAVIRFGTSSWAYPGWQGIVYNRSYKSDKEFRDKCLEEYGRFAWFRAIGIDSSFYSPPRRETLEKYAEQLPGHIYWISKVWEEITIPIYGGHPRYGEKAGKPNPNFLNADLFCERVLKPYTSPDRFAQLGPFVFQFQTMGRPYDSAPLLFLEKLAQFFSKLPRNFLFAVELRNKEFLTPEYFSLLNEHGLTHCFNHWTNMPDLQDQMKAAASAGGLSAPFYVSRLLTPRGVSYEQAVRKFSPYSELKAPIQNVRRDIVRLARRAIERNVPAFVSVNNRLEGNAPLSIETFGKLIVKEIGPASN